MRHLHRMHFTNQNDQKIWRECPPNFETSRRIPASPEKRALIIQYCEHGDCLICASCNPLYRVLLPLRSLGDARFVRLITALDVN